MPRSSTPFYPLSRFQPLPKISLSTTGRKMHSSFLRRSKRPILVFTHVPFAQFGYVILDFVADPIPGLHRRVLRAVTIARWPCRAMVHFHPGVSPAAGGNGALARPPSASEWGEQRAVTSCCFSPVSNRWVIPSTRQERREFVTQTTKISTRNWWW